MIGTAQLRGRCAKNSLSTDTSLLGPLLGYSIPQPKRFETIDEGPAQQRRTALAGAKRNLAIKQCE
jgi:hypothetical protein